jgi:hypothetical protein
MDSCEQAGKDFFHWKLTIGDSRFREEIEIALFIATAVLNFRKLS